MPRAPAVKTGAGGTGPVVREVVARRVGRGAGQGCTGQGGDFTYCVVDSAPGARPGERRDDRRAPTRLRDAQIGLRRGHVLAECRIRDRSRHGARLRLDKPHPLPRSFLLTDAASRAHFYARLVWQVGCDAGVRLTPVGEG